MTNKEAIKVLCWPDKQEVPISLWNEAIEIAISALQAQELSETQNALDTISRQALCEYALNQKDKSVTPNDIMRFPSAEPEIVRCKDCIFHGLCRASTRWAVAPKDDWYCADAERRTDGTD